MTFSSYAIPTYLYKCEKVVVGYLDISMNESIPNILPSSVIVIIESVFLFVAVFSTIANGYPGFTKVILK